MKPPQAALGLLAFLLVTVSPLGAAIVAEKNQLVFDPQLLALVHQAINASTTSIDLELYKLTDRGVIVDLSRAAARGVRLRIILCPSESANRLSARQLRGPSLEVRWYPLRRPNQIMHLKVGCFDGKRLFFGSANWTHWGLTLHHEGVLDLRDPGIIAQMAAQFEQDWKKSDLNQP